jgi:mannose-6-phosphate isomerase-like protein (cupin superfamily)
MSDDVIQLTPNQTLQVRSSTPEALELEAEWTPGSVEPPAHLHPLQDEHFEVLEGELNVVIGGERRVLAAGDVLDIPRGLAHRMWNAADDTARATWRVTPRLKTEEMFRTIASGGVEDFLERYADEFRFAL